MSIAVNAENGVTFDQTREVFDAFERDLLARTEELEIDAVAANFSARNGSVTVYFRDDASTQRTTAELTNEIRAMLPQLAGYNFSVGRRWGRGGGGALACRSTLPAPTRRCWRCSPRISAPASGRCRGRGRKHQPGIGG